MCPGGSASRRWRCADVMASASRRMALPPTAGAPTLIQTIGAGSAARPAPPEAGAGRRRLAPLRPAPWTVPPRRASPGSLPVRARATIGWIAILARDSERRAWSPEVRGRSGLAVVLLWSLATTSASSRPPGCTPSSSPPVITACCGGSHAPAGHDPGDLLDGRSTPDRPRGSGEGSERRRGPDGGGDDQCRRLRRS